MSSVSLNDRTIAKVFRGLGQQVDDKDFCDVTVVVGQKKFLCHRVVLASVSEYFKTSLKPSWREDPNRPVEISHEDVSPESFGYLMDILYRGIDMVDNDTVKDILKMSVYLQIQYLKEHCVEFLRNAVKPEMCLESWQFAQKYDLDELAETSIKMAVNKFDKVSIQKEFLALPKSMLLILLSYEEQLHKDVVCKAILRWVEADQNERQIHLLELLPFISFTELSSKYLCEMMTYFNHPFTDVMSEQIKEALNYCIQGQQNRDATLTRRILARQPRPLTSTDIKNCAVMFGGYIKDDEPLQDTYVFDCKKRYMERYSLAPLPEDIGLDFASCTWYNEVYVSGGSQLPTFFAVYKPGDNEWEVLPSLPDDGRGKHAMAAVSSSIFVLGGLKETATGDRTVSPSVLKYSTSSKQWSIFCQLPLGIQETTASTLGHRIYLFGGVDSNGANTDLVQCVDTLSGCAYQAGRLPSLTCGARALSNGGRIYVVRPQGDVLSMRENFLLAEEIEKRLSDRKEEGEGCDKSSDTIQSPVSFKEVGKFPERDHFNAYLHAGEIMVCGGETKDRQLLKEFDSISLADGNTLKKFMKLVTGAAKFDLHLLNIPTEFFREETVASQSFCVGDKVWLTSREHKRLLEKFQRTGAHFPSGTGTITAIDYDSMEFRASFQYWFHDDWSGTLTQLQHADDV